MKINIFRGELTDNSAKKEALFNNHCTWFCTFSVSACAHCLNTQGYSKFLVRDLRNHPWFMNKKKINELLSDVFIHSTQASGYCASSARGLNGSQGRNDAALERKNDTGTCFVIVCSSASSLKVHIQSFLTFRARKWTPLLAESICNI